MIMLDNTVECRAALDPARPWRSPLRARVDRCRLRAHVRRAFARRREARRPVRPPASFAVGLGIFTASSLARRAAPTPEFLIGARVSRAPAAALMSPATLDHHRHLPARERGQAIDPGGSRRSPCRRTFRRRRAHGACRWSSIFFVNAPIGVLAIVASLLLIEESKDTSDDQRLDLPGLLSSALGLFALTSRTDRGQQLRVDVRRILGDACRSGCARLVRRTGAARAPPDARAGALPQSNLHGRDPSSSSSPSRSPASSSLRLALYAERPSTPRPGRCCSSFRWTF